MKLNLACGNDYKEGYINIDNQSMFPDCKVDVSADIFTLEQEENSIDEILVNHFVMYTRPDELNPLLEKWYKWLKLGGKLSIETIDVKEIAKILNDDSRTTKDMDMFGLTNLFGTEVTGPHRWAYYAESLYELMDKVGYGELFIEKGEKKPLRDFKIIGTK